MAACCGGSHAGAASVGADDGKYEAHDFAREEEDLEALFEDSDIPSSIREARMAAVKDAANYLQKGGFGECEEVTEERQVLEITANELKCVVHFMVPGFHRCQIMQSHLDKLCKSHFKTKFIKVNAENSHWVCAKLNIRELPAVLCFVGAKNVDRVVGFNDFGANDGFTTEQLESRLGKSGVITLSNGGLKESSGYKTIFGYGKTADRFNKDDSDSDDD